MNLVSLLLGHVDERPDAVALVDGDREITFAELEALAAATAGSFGRLGVTPGERVAIVGANDVFFVAAYLGALWAGAVAVPLNPLAPPAVLEREIERVGARVVVCGPAASGLLGLPGAVGEDALPPGDALAVEVERDEAELAVLLFTSGTAGAPRAAMLTHGNLAANIGQVQGHPGLHVGAEDVGLAALPFFHVFGINVALGVGLAGGIRTVLLGQFDPARAARLVRDHGVTILAAVPTMFAAFLELPTDVAPADTFASVRIAVSGAAELPPDCAAAFRERFGVTIYEGYGLTEAAPIVCTTAVERGPHWGSIGPPLPGIEVRLVAADGDDALVGDPGEIWVRGPNVFAGYWGDDEATARVLADGWLHTGDVAVADDDGYLSLVDRVKDLVIVSGFNVYPAEVEDVLRTYPGVADAAVIGVPSARTGEAVAAWVVAEPGVALTVDALREHTSRQLARYKVPSTLEIVDALPRDAAGKLLRRVLRPATS